LLTLPHREAAGDPVQAVLVKILSIHGVEKVYFHGKIAPTREYTLALILRE
jgi:hypothetical protein